MIKKLFTVITLTLALNFLAATGAVGYLFQTRQLDRAKVQAIREILFPTSAPATQTADAAADASTQPSLRLDELLARSSGRSAVDQVDFIQHAFDTQMEQLDRRRREMDDMQRQIELARQQLAHERAQLADAQKQLDARQQLQTHNENDAGFQAALQLYLSMPPKQAKDIFKTMDDSKVVQFLQAMEPRAADKILKEFKTPEEMDRVAKLMERLQAPQQASTKEP